MLLRNASGNEPGIFRDNSVNTIVADTKAPWFLMASAAVVSTVQIKHVIASNKKGFQLSVPHEFWEMTENAQKYFYIPWKKFSMTN